MGLIGKIIGGAIGAKVLNKLQNGARQPAGQEYIPANTSQSYPTGPGGTLLQKCGRFCQDNPKLVTTVGSAALAIALAALAKRRGAM